MRISFCSTCMGRLHHIREALPQNLRDNADYAHLEYVLLDYNSQDGLEQWARDTLKNEIRSGRVVYWRERAVKYFSAAHAKNLANCLATGDVLVNLDGDNFTGVGYAKKIEEFFNNDPKIVIRTPKRASVDLWGRVVLRREDFHAVRGNDELFHGWGYDDVDIVDRAHRQLKLRVVDYLHPGSHAIPHPDNERIRFVKGKVSRHGLNQENMAIARARKVGQVINPNGYGAASVFKNLEQEPRRVIWGV